MKATFVKRKADKFFKTLFLIWFLLCLFKFLNFDFRVDLSKLFWVSFILFSFFIFWEITLNFQYYVEIFNKDIMKIKKYYNLKFEIYKNNKFFNKFSKQFPLNKSFIFGVLFTTLFIVWDFLGKYIFKKSHLFVIFLAGVISDIVLFKQKVDLFFLLFAFIWIVIVKKFKFSGSVSFLYSFILFIFCGVFIFLGERVYIDKTSVWIFLFLTIGIFQNILSSFKEI